MGQGSCVLNFTTREFLSIVDRGSIFVEMAVPSLRALEGRLLRKSRTDLDLAEKGLTLVLTSVMKRVIILFELCSWALDRGEVEGAFGGKLWWWGLERSKGVRIEVYVSRGG